MRARIEGILFWLLLAAAAGLSLWALWYPAGEQGGHILSRLAAAGAAFLLLRRVGYRPPRRAGAWRYAGLGLCLLVALNNAPLEAIWRGDATLVATPAAYVHFFVWCIATALLEELLFRAWLLSRLLLRMGDDTRGRIRAILLSAAIFGLAHLLNLFSGAGLVATLLQVGYSFLVGAAAGALYCLFGSVFFPIVFHALYNMAGLLYPTLGRTAEPGIVTVTVTVALALFAAGTLLLGLLGGVKACQNLTSKGKK